MRWICVDGEYFISREAATFHSIQKGRKASRAGVATTEGSYLICYTGLRMLLWLAIFLQFKKKKEE
jgi:hypothetical protein